MTESIMFTLLPNGVTLDGHNLKLSVFVSPRLVPPPAGTNTLQDFQSHWQNWPTVLKSLSFAVTFKQGASSYTPLVANLVTSTGPPAIPDSTLWPEIFPLSTFVQPYAFNGYPGVNILSYPARNVHSFIQNQYLAVAASYPQSFPPISTLGMNGFGRIGFYDPGQEVYAGAPKPWVPRAQVDAEISRLLLDSADGPLSGRHAINYNATTYTNDNHYGLPNSTEQKQFVHAMDFEQVNLFYKSLNPVTFIADNTPSNPQHGDLQVPKIDFHAEVSAFSQYTGTTDSPGLMRRLGLVFDLLVPVTSTDLAAIQALTPGTVQLAVSGWSITSVSPTMLTPMTACKLDSSKSPILFVPQVNPSPPSGSHEIGNGSNLSAVDNGIGMLLLANGNYDFIQLDLDAGAIKALEFAIALLRLGWGPNRAPDTPQNLSLPSLKSGGISITKFARAYALALTLGTTSSNNTNLTTNAPTTLYAEDLVRGYHVDAYNDKQTSTTKWLSLCWRKGIYNYNGSPIPGIPPDEGWVSMGVTQNVNPPPSMGPTLNLHETMIRWKGWSLAAPRPSSIKRISQDNEHNTENIDNYDANQALADSNNSDSWKNNSPPINVPLSVTFQVLAAGSTPVPPVAASSSMSLPSLRFGRTYYMRARAVDLAGNGLPVDDPSIMDVSSVHPWLSPKITYTRFEPVQAPTVVLREALNPASPAYVNGNPLSVAPPGSQRSPGETLNNVVFRSFGGKNDTDPLASGPGATAYNNYLNTLLTLTGNTKFLDHSERNIAPPRTTESMAELHGMFDDASGRFNPNGTGNYADIVARDQWNFDHYQTSLPNCELMNYPAQPNFANPDDRAVHYIADPMAQGGAFKFFDPAGTLLKSLLVPFYGSEKEWPNVKLFKLTVKESTTNTFDAQYPSGFLPGNELTVTLPKGTYVDVQLSSFLSTQNAPTSGPQTMGILDWVQKKNPAQLPTLATLATQGQFWMITPYRKLRLVHAVQQPAGAPGLPKFSSLSISPARNPGDTFASLAGGMSFDGPSTVKLDLLAAWEEPIDSPGSDPYNPQSVQDGQPWGAPNLTPQSPAVTVAVNSGAVVTSGPASAGGVHHAHHVVEFPGLVFGSTSLSFSGLTAKKHEFGDTKRRLVRYTLAGTTRYLEYLPDQVWKDPQGKPILDTNGLPGATRDKQTNMLKTAGIVRYANDDVIPDSSDNTKWVTILDIPSTARPDKPKILYVVPTFQWDRKASSEPYLPEWSSTGRTKSPLISLKSGQGLRVYMDRPWYSSGFGELLGVVLWPGDKQGDIIPPDSLKHLVTQWGQDPLWASAAQAGLPAISNFTGTASSKYPFATLEETGDTVVIVPYNVAFDKSRNLWYADLRLVLPTYMPFVRLALVRYQANSVSPDHISPVVLTDFAQITPDRGLAVTGSNGSTKLQVALVGLFPQAGTQSQVNTVWMYLQSRQSGVPDPDLGWKTTNVIVQLTPNSQNTPTLYQGSITLPVARGTPGTDYRLVVAEYEYFSHDSNPIVSPPPNLDILNPYQGNYRLVYAETVPI